MFTIRLLVAYKVSDQIYVFMYGFGIAYLSQVIKEE